MPNLHPALGRFYSALHVGTCQAHFRIFPHHCLVFLMSFEQGMIKKKSLWVLKSLMGGAFKNGVVFRIRRGPSPVSGILPVPVFLLRVYWGFILSLSGGWVPDNTLHLWVWHPHDSLYIPAASFCSKTPILELLQTQRSVCVFRMSG